jgi:mRNA interferase RelE/StbE
MSSIKYEVVFKKSALKELLTLPKKIQTQLLDAIQLLSINPHTEILQIKKMKATDLLYRLRIGDYRVLYTLEHHIIKISVIKIGHRKDVYR